MAKILAILTDAWQSMPTDTKERIIAEVTPNKVVGSFIASLSASYDAQMRHAEAEQGQEQEDEDEIIDVEFVQSDLDDGFGV